MDKFLFKASLIVLAFAVLNILFDFEENENNENSKKNQYEINTYSLSENIENIDINVYKTNIELVASDSDYCRVECIEEDKGKYDIRIKENTLVIKPNSLSTTLKEKITIYLPKKVFNLIKVETSSGNIKFDSILVKEGIIIETNSGAVTINSIESQGDIELITKSSDILINKLNVANKLSIEGDRVDVMVLSGSCKDFQLIGTNGNISLNKFVALNMMSIKTSNGHVKFNKTDASQMFIETRSVSGNLLTGKTFIIDTMTENVNVPDTTGGICEIKTTLGYINIFISQSDFF